MSIADDKILSDLIILEIDNFVFNYNSAYYGGGTLYINRDYVINDLEYCEINAAALPSMTPTMLLSTYLSISPSLPTNRPTTIPTKLPSNNYNHSTIPTNAPTVQSELNHLVFQQLNLLFLIMILIWQWMMD